MAASPSSTESHYSVANGALSGAPGTRTVFGLYQAYALSIGRPEVSVVASERPFMSCDLSLGYHFEREVWGIPPKNPQCRRMILYTIKERQWNTQAWTERFRVFNLTPPPNSGCQVGVGWMLGRSR